MDGFLPVSMIRIKALLSPWDNRVGDRCRRTCHKERAWRPVVRSAKSADTNSASGVERETHDCHLLTPEMGKHVRGSRMAKCRPLVDRLVPAHPAKSALGK